MRNLRNKKIIRIIFSMSVLLTLSLVGCGENKGKNVPTNNETSTQKSDSEKSASSEQVEQKTQEAKTQTKNTNTKNTNNTNNAPKFSKQELAKSVKPQFSTPWETSSNETYNACIEGKGEEASEEGVGKILVKDNNGNNFSFQIANNSKISPRNIEWVDDANLLVIVGSSQGTVSKGGNLYMLNVKTGNTSVVLETSDKKQQIMSSKKDNNNINLKVTVYEDDNYNKSHIENWVIYSFDSSLNKSMDVKNSEGKVVYTIN
jgi:hypothetical protein